MKKNSKRMIIAYAVAVAVLGTIVYIIPSVTGMLTPTEILRYDTLQVTDEEACYISANEKVYLAASGGSINYYIKNGTKVRAGDTILALNHTSQDNQVESKYKDIITKLSSDAITKSNYKSEFNGIVSYYADGFESVFSPENIEKLTYDEIKKLSLEEPTNLTRKTSAKGEPLYKIIENDEWYITCWVQEGSVAKYEQGKSVTVRLPAGDVRAEISSIKEEHGIVWQVVLKTNRFYEDFGQARKVDATIVTSEYSGLIIPNKSIAAQEGQIGVYVKTKGGDYTFVPIKVITSDGQNSVAAESLYYDDKGNQVKTVEVYDEILKNPGE
ncbi:MAG: HlyD family efflux transporter periplasmic adaptor subunit [Eubacteriales bacterium]|nr:HlyD family efflux transporter periplasmic adaptor subunit [Eubacteriales bacterium]MDD4389309.1 HlyD family efflux transporter periplasmic adaptor subunit [Eubacteriales bacterium]